MNNRALVALLVLALVPAALAQEAMPPAKKADALALAALPETGARDPKPGDWARFKIAQAFDEGKGAPAKEGSGTVTLKVAQVGAKGATLEGAPESWYDLVKPRGGEDRKPRSFTVPTGGHTVASFVDGFFGFRRGREGALVENLATTDEKRKVGDRELACKKVTFGLRRDEGSIDKMERFDVIVWFSSDVKAAGVVAIELVGAERKGRAGRFRATWTLEAFGSEGTADLGTAK